MSNQTPQDPHLTNQPIPPHLQQHNVVGGSPLAPKPPYLPPSRKKHTARNLILTGIGGLVVGLVIGAAPSNSATDAATAASQPAVTKTVPGPKTTVTAPPVVKTVSTVPEACKTALDAADRVIATAGQGFSIVAEAMNAASEFDADGINAATLKLTTLNREKLTPQLAAYQTARDECQS